VVDEEVQIFGGYGYIRGSHAEKAYRNARINRIWEGTNEINRIVIVNTILRRLGKASFDAAMTLEQVSKEIQNLQSVELDNPETLEAQAQLVHVARHAFLLVLAMAYQKFGSSLREEQQLIGILSDMIIEIYALESTVLRTNKILNGKNPADASLPLRLTKTLCYDGSQMIGRLAREGIEAMDQGKSLTKHLQRLRELTSPPALNALQIKKEIADTMIRYGHYLIL
jgi:alkylation response protein AidB-like acyl-CoA dehydrogenase